MENEINKISPEQVEETPATVSQPDETVEQTGEVQPAENPAAEEQAANGKPPILQALKNKKKLVICAAAALVALVVIITVVLPMFKSVDDYLADGNYAKAYSKASDERKEEILLENAIACVTKKATNSIENTGSPFLESAWVYERDGGSTEYILYTGYGYYVYIYMESAEYHFFQELYTSESNLYKSATLPSNPTQLDYVIAISENSYKLDVINATSGFFAGSTQLSEKSIENINNLYIRGKLQNVELLEENIPED